MRAARVMRAARRSAAVLAVLALCGCEALAPRPKVEVAMPTHAVPAPLARASGCSKCMDCGVAMSVKTGLGKYKTRHR